MPNYPRREATKCKPDRLASVIYTDFTVQDFADSTQSTKPGQAIRLKKADQNIFSSPARIVRNMQNTRDDLPWYEQDLADFDLSPGEECTPGEIFQTDVETQGTRNKRMPKACKNVGGGEETGTVAYPPDFWFLLGDYIDPEDVGRFALICCGSHIVTHTAGFWQRLYKRSCCHGDSNSLPWDLQSSHMERVHGLRSRVIRYLFHVHPVFVERFRTHVPFERDPDILHGCSCSLMWYHKQRTKWLFHFKFLKPNQSKCSLISGKGAQSKNYRLSADDDIHVNDQEGSYIMQVICPDFVSLPSTMGLVLTKAAISVSQGMRHHKVRLHFDQTFSVDDSSRGSSDISLVIDPVLNLYVLPWWHPRYTELLPSNNFQSLP